MGDTATSLLVLLCIVIAALCCMSFYLFRSVGIRQKEQQAMSTAVKSAVEVVIALTEKGVPSINNKVIEMESRVKMVEQNVKKIAEVEATNGEAIVEIQGAVSGISTDRGPIQLSRVPEISARRAIARGMTDEDAIKAARAARQKVVE